jgi:hypothetical protein
LPALLHFYPVGCCMIGLLRRFLPALAKWSGGFTASRLRH